MDFEKVLTHRVSARKYNGKMPDDAAIQKIIDAALLGPIISWHKLHLSVVTNQEVMKMAENAADEFFTGVRKGPHLYGAPVWIVLSGKMYDDEDANAARMKNDNLFWTVGSLIENMELQAVALGIASCGINTAVVSIRSKPEIKKAIGIPDGYEPLASVIIGYSDVNYPERHVKPELIPVNYVK